VAPRWSQYALLAIFNALALNTLVIAGPSRAKPTFRARIAIKLSGASYYRLLARRMSAFSALAGSHFFLQTPTGFYIPLQKELITNPMILSTAIAITKDRTAVGSSRVSKR